MTSRQASWLDNVTRGDYRRITNADVQDEEHVVNGQSDTGNGRAILPHTGQGEIEAGQTIHTRVVQDHSNAWEEE